MKIKNAIYFINSIIVVLLFLLISLTGNVHAQNQSSKLNNVLNEEKARITSNQNAQKTIDGLQENVLSAIEQYEEDLSIFEGLQAYNQMMDRQVSRQLTEIQSLRQSIADVSIIERQILPLLARMVNRLDEFINLDVPFLLDERKTRVNDLKNTIERVDVTVAEKTRRVFEAYQIENDYGRTLESYRGKLELDNKEYDVDYLRVGRVALLYQNIGDQNLGMWHQNEQEWKPLVESKYRRYFEKGVSVARQEISPELMTIPVIYQGER